MAKILKQRQCKVCSKEFVPKRSLQKWCSIPCAITLANQRAWRIKKKTLSENLMTHAEWQKIMQNKINIVVRNIDANFPCISSGIMPKQAHAGHRVSVGANNSIRFNLFNIFLQSAYQNTYKHGNIIDYDRNLIKLFGYDTCKDKIFSLEEKYPYIKLSITEIKEKIVIINSILKEQKSGGWVAQSQQQRIEIREQLNKIIGIY